MHLCKDTRLNVQVHKVDKHLSLYVSLNEGHNEDCDIMVHPDLSITDSKGDIWQFH